ncbi:MAG TPA: amidohydrolase family protein [Candidatus Binataceae bacterium]|nr:amidohydrolase family protein [Candidatus Binataceae bacterium]
METGRLISADSHFVEPPTMWAERLDKRFRDRAPHTIKNLKGREGEFFVCENILPMSVAGFFGAGVPAAELAEHNKRGFDAAPKSVWDAAYRIKDQDRDGVEAEVIYTSMGMPLFGLDDAELRAACFRAFNDWAAEYCSYDLKRLIPLGLITLEDIPGAVTELTRIAKQGMRGAMIWAEPPDDRPYSHPDYEPFWAAAQELKMPLSLHILTGRKGTGTGPSIGKEFLLSLSTLHHQIERSLAVMVLGGVFEKFPGLRIVSAENDVGWMAYFLYRLDTVQHRLGPANGLSLPMRASDYVKRNVYATFIADPVFVNLLDSFGPDNVMWSSDYPHTAATFPRSQEIVSKRLGSLNSDQLRKIVHDTAARVYGLA